MHKLVLPFRYQTKTSCRMSVIDLGWHNREAENFWASMQMCRIFLIQGLVSFGLRAKNKLSYLSWD